jgi:hypothetical protein
MSLMLLTKHEALQMYGRVEAYLHVLLTSILEGHELASHPGCITRRKEPR